MLILSIKRAIARFWFMALSVSFAIILTSYIQSGFFAVSLFVIIFFVAIFAVVLIGAPIEYQKIKTKK